MASGQPWPQSKPFLKNQRNLLVKKLEEMVQHFFLFYFPLALNMNMAQ